MQKGSGQEIVRDSEIVRIQIEWTTAQRQAG